MADIFVMFGLMVLSCGGFVALYVAYMYLIAKVSRISFRESLKWWEN